MIKVIIFDYGGVIGKEPHENEICLAIAKRFGLGYDFVKNEYNTLEFRFLTNRISKKEFYIRLARLLGVSAKELGRVWDAVYYQKKPKLNGKVINIVKALKPYYKLALLSDVFPGRDAILKKYGCYKFFPSVILSSKVRMQKPDKVIYRYTVKRLNAKANECLFIDDRERNIKSAEKLGMRTILFKNAEQLEKELKQYL
ncbi:MAG: HAD family phosphatase [Candidatus Aenigmarchaeota archaeon]|nr:HAD family phosphatase [Candidatus Aenigmarchaeota archaeon]